MSIARAVIACPEKFGDPPDYRATHLGTVRTLRGDLGPVARQVAEEQCDLREELMIRGQDCNRSCGLGTPDSPLRSRYEP